MIPLSKTAALVIHWAKPLYHGCTGAYLDDLDLSSSDELLKNCNGICPWYGEVILNRKFQIEKMADDWLSVDDNEQVLVIAAGMAPLSMEILQRYPKARITEVDIHGMDDKKGAYSRFVPQHMGRIEFLEMDICSDNLIQELFHRSAWFTSEKPTLVIIEGISYYITEKQLQSIVSSFKGNRMNRIILEYLIPDEDIEENVRMIPELIFKTIADDAGLSSLSRYSRFGIRQTMESGGAMVLTDRSMSDMELFRKGRHEFFTDDRFGWIRCALIRFEYACSDRS